MLSYDLKFHSLYVGNFNIQVRDTWMLCFQVHKLKQ